MTMRGFGDQTPEVVNPRWAAPHVVEARSALVKLARVSLNLVADVDDVDDERLRPPNTRGHYSSVRGASHRRVR
jgi:hypothetical protein